MVATIDASTKIWTKEGGKWWARNTNFGHQESLSSPELIEKYLREAGIKFKSVLEVGCSSGYNLEHLRRKFRVKVTGIEPGMAAVKHAHKVRPEILIKRGFAHSLPFADSSFDLVIIHFVFHWVNHKYFFQSVGEAVRVAKKYLLIGDFYPVKSERVEYHHRSGSGIYTWKRLLAEVFVAGGAGKVVWKKTLGQGENRRKYFIVDVSESGLPKIKLLDSALFKHK